MIGDDDVIDISVLPLGRDPIDVLLSDDVPRDMADLAALVSLIRVVGEGPPPAPSPELADLIARGAPPAPRAARHLAPARRGALARVAGVGIAMKLSLGVTAAAAGVAGAGMLPGDTGSAVRRAIQVVTPIEMPPPSGDPSGDGAGKGTAGDGGGAGHDGPRADGSTQGDRDGGRNHDPDGDPSGRDRHQDDRDGRDGRTVGGWWEDDDHDDDTAARGDDAEDRPEEPDDPPVRPRRLR